MSERLADAEDLEASRKIAAVEASMADNDRLLAQITPEIERLKEASNSAAAAELLKSSSNCDAEHW